MVEERDFENSERSALLPPQAPTGDAANQPREKHSNASEERKYIAPETFRVETDEGIGEREKPRAALKKDAVESDEQNAKCG